MNPASYDMADYLESEGLGIVANADEPVDESGLESGEDLGFDWGIFVNRLPDRPIHCIAIMETPSPSPTTPLNMKSLGTNPFDVCYFQVQVRAAGDKDCWDKLLAVAKALNGLGQHLVEEEGAAAVLYSSVLRRSDYLPIEVGEKDVFTRSTNFVAYRQELVAD